MEIGEVIKMFIKKRKLSQGQVAKDIGKSRTALSQIINGAYKPLPETLESLSKVLNVPVPVFHFLCIDEESVPPENRALFRALAPSMERYLLDVFNTSPEDLEIEKKAL
ncbi:helix-turn-helix domain-containing protein [Flavobacterium microcysteis]|uniref:Helix-turn-helix transcriptional regulator n=1 Tax=Flavobacterium microcysteis TaxID=2596891 RepID=A0A501Q799_9FLAO|nr:helix-turn-helix transcriptional regulator [Flavobacterium microcysteis]TPD68543.1 helix-turn-helix transcriptional regulator [Flavobacterium microcysteis]